MTRAGRPFPATRLSVIGALATSDDEARREAYERLVRAYWRPVYTYLRLFRGCDPSEAEDFTQGFFTHALDRGTLERFDPERARFRTWLRTCLDGFVANERKAANRQKRGGGVAHVSLDFQTVEGALRTRDVPASADPEEQFHREWMRSLFSSAVDELRTWCEESNRTIDFTLFARYDLEPSGAGDRPSYSQLASELGVPVSKVGNALHAMRARLRATVLARLREVTATDAEYLEESRALFDGGSDE